MRPKVLVIVGPTAAGKTGLAIELAKSFDGEIISADSRQVYKGLDIGSGKATKAEMEGIPHHLLDIADPRDTYTAADFTRDGERALSDILLRKKLPIIAGGTFFYIDALLGRFSFPEVPPDPLLRQELEILPTDALYERLKAKDSRYAEIVDKDNPRRLIRAIEIVEALGAMPERTRSEKYHVLTLGITLPREVLHQKIHDRLVARLEHGMVDEVRGLLESGVTYERMQDLGLEYRYVSQYLLGKLEYAAMVTELETKIRQFAKRQMTWLKRDEKIVWVEPTDRSKITSLVADFLRN